MALVNEGYNIQQASFLQVEQEVDAKEDLRNVSALLKSLKASQRECWILAEAISSGQSLAEIQGLVRDMRDDEVRSSRDRHRNTLLQLAALNDRGDVILWLWERYGLRLSSSTSVGAHSSLRCDTLQLCRKAGCLTAASIVERIVSAEKVRRFCWTHFHTRRTKKKPKSPTQAVIRIQTMWRCWWVYVRNRELLSAALGSWRAFQGKWGPLLNLLNNCKDQGRKQFSWTDVKLQHDLAIDLGEDCDPRGVQEMDRLLLSAAAVQTPETETVIGGSEEESVELEAFEEDYRVAIQARDVPSSEGTAVVSAVPVCAVELAQAVKRWFDRADGAYRGMLTKKLMALAQGRRSYALSKRLKHCSTVPVFESKLDAGLRILWTKLKRDDANHLLVWCVSKHDNVPHHVQIEHSCNRISRLQTTENRLPENTSPAIDTQHSYSVSAVSGELAVDKDTVLLDPSRNVPLKTYLVQSTELPLLSEGKTRLSLRLNQQEQGVRLQKGTTLLLGRSGTGKTLCLIDRMEHDGQRSGGDCRQLFVTRSARLCEFVRRYHEHQYIDLQPQGQSISYYNFNDFLQKFDELSPSNPYAERVNMTENERSKYWVENRRVQFRQFREAVFPEIRSKDTRIEPLVVWTQIRSFLKGSIEAATEGHSTGLLPKELYLDMSIFSLDRCRLLPPQREEVFTLFERYQEWIRQRGWWDDMDRAMAMLLPCLASLGKSHAGEMQQWRCFDKVYVDEVQDNTQTEIALYFMVTGFDSDALFLAGDPAQSVVEGVEFRFEEVRSLIYKLSGQQEKLQRPTKLLVNYRSHSGILDCAAAVLDRMLAMYPGAAKTLPSDRGLFSGPRPAFFQADERLQDLKRMLASNEGLVVICPDDEVSRVEELFSNLILGVRAAKGLEFGDVVLLDLFSSIPERDFQAWKELFFCDEDNTKNCFTKMDPNRQYTHPQLEPQLKILYTAITRCVNRLIFVETRRSKVGSQFFRWLKHMDLAEGFSLNVQEEDGVPEWGCLMTADEWRLRGIDLVLAAEVAYEDRLEVPKRMLEQAVLCLDRAEDAILSRVARANLRLLVTKREILAMQSSHNRGEKGGMEKGRQSLTDVEEGRIVEAVLGCVCVGLWREAQLCCIMVQSFLSLHTQKYLNQEVIRKVGLLNIVV